jgi:hypothetical protein
MTPSDLSELMDETSAHVSVISSRADRDRAEALADRLNDIVGGQDAPTALLAIAILMANLPPGAHRQAIYGAVVTIADAYATSVAAQGALH